MNEEEVEKIRERRKSAREAYYNLTPMISDQEYDALGEKLRRFNQDDSDFAPVGAPAPKLSLWEKVKHEIPMGSLDKVNSDDEFVKWVKKVKSEIFIITHKIDGSSIELVYRNGELVRGVTRGDGVIGENVTFNINQIPDVPKKIKIHEDIIVRGEIVMTKSIFQEKYSEKYANPRNTAAGKVRDKKSGGVDCADLSLIAYTLMSKSAPKEESLRFKALEKMGFQIPDYKIGNYKEIQKWHNETKERRSDIPYEIDGTVIRISDIALQEKLGDHNMRPYGQIAWKFDPEMAITTVKDIRWQVGPTSRITPVASVDAISVGGVTITSVSLHNIAMFKNLALFPGCKVLISRRNDVIPYIEENIDIDSNLLLLTS